MTAENITEGKVVTLEFELRDHEGDLIDRCDASDPLHYLHGAGNLVPGLESALEHKSVGDAVDVVVPPEEGYGPREPVDPQPVPRKNFPEDFELEVGMPFWVESDDGDELELYVAAVGDDEVLVDVNHPLAGETLHFKVKVLAIRDSTEEERDHGHPHVGNVH